MEDNKKRRSTGLLLSVLGVLSLVLITAGVTYAFFNYAKEGQTVNTVRTGTIEFAYTETDGNGSGISVTNAMPTEDAVGAAVNSNSSNGGLFHFQVKSKTPTNANIPYYVTLRKTGGTLENGQVKVYLESTTNASDNGANYTFTGTKGSAGFSVYSFEKILNDHLASSGLPNSVKTGTVGEEEAIIYHGIVPSGRTEDFTNTFVLRMWLSKEDSVNPNQAADYSSYEFMLKTKANASNQPVTTTTSDGNGGYKTISLPVASNTTAINAETAIAEGSFITSTAYYALPETASTIWYCDNAVIAGENAECSGTKTSKTFEHGRSDYERIAYVNMTDKTVYTQSQALAGKIPTATATALATVDEFGNYNFGSLANYTATEQYYRLNDATFTAIVNVYADAVVE